jgi:peptidoglycan/LPS O-acetylase OafA/YrhL
MDTVTDRPRLDHLQILRCVAASLVVVDHALIKEIDHAAIDASRAGAATFVGYFGVATFFVISGYIMCLTTNGWGHSSADARYFAARRIARIVPLYWIATLVAIAANADTPPSVGEVLKSLFFVPYQGADGLWQPLLAVGWTLNFEMFFYAIFAICLCLRRTVALKVCLVALVGLGVTGLVAEDLPGVLGFYADPIVLMFALGIVLFLAPWRFRWGGASLSVLLGVTVATVIPPILVGADSPHDGGWLALIYAGCMISVMLALTPANDEPGWQRALVAAGDASYETYLFHIWVLVVLAAVWFRLPASSSPVGIVAFVVVGVVVANVAGIVIHRILMPWVIGPAERRARTLRPAAA